MWADAKKTCNFLGMAYNELMDETQRGNKMKYVEFFGVICGVIGSFLVANGLMQFGYPVFLTSSACLLYTATRQKNKNLMLLQFVFLCANINGLINFF